MLSGFRAVFQSISGFSRTPCITKGHKKMKKRNYLLKLLSAITLILSVTVTGSLAAALGDVDNDSQVTAADARLALRASVNLEKYTADSAEFKSADIDGNGIITAADARTILRVAVSLESFAKEHTPDIPAATCTQDKVCTTCGEILEAKHHTDANGDSICDICKVNIVKSELLGEFNTAVNSLKNGSHTASGFTHSTTLGKVNSSDIKYSAGFKILVNSYNLTAKNEEKMPTEKEMNKIFKEEFNTSESSDSIYSRTQKTITDSTYPIVGSHTVSELTDSDTSSVTKTKIKGIDFISSLPDSLTTDSGTFSLARFKNASIGDVNKVTVVLRTEKYSELKNTSAPTALMHIGQSDIREMAKEATALSDSEVLGDYGTLEMNCKEVATNATVVYYFDAATNAPVAAKYTTSVIMTNTVDMSFELLGETAMTGNAEFSTTLTDDSYYFFDDFFPGA